MYRAIFALATSLAFGLPVGAQAPAFCFAHDPDDPQWRIDDYDPLRDADDWCKLAHNEPHKAKRQLAKAVALVRGENNPNRFYFDPKQGSQPGLYIQLLRDWMKDDEGRPRWKATRWLHRGTSIRGYATSLSHRIVLADRDDPNRRINVTLVGAGGGSGPSEDFATPYISIDGFDGTSPDFRLDAPLQAGFGAAVIWAQCDASAYISASNQNGISAAMVKVFVEGVLDQQSELGC